MRDAIDESISRDAAGLDDMMLKKMLLAYNTGKYSRNADIIIELTKAEAEALKKENTLPSSFNVIKGSDLEQLKYSGLDEAADKIRAWLKDEDIEEEIKEKKIKSKNYYLHTKGVLVFYNENYDPNKSDKENKEHELVYYDEEVMNKIFTEEFQANRYGAKSDYALSAWEYLSTKCYTDGDKGMRIYAHETVEEELIEWTFEDNDCQWYDVWDNVAINKQMISDEYLTYDKKGWFFKGGLLDTAKKQYIIQDIDYYPLVSQYTTPIEFMIDLLNISSSKEFVNAFIDKMTNQTEIILKLYKTSKSTSTEITEIAQEKTKVELEANITARVIKINHTGGELKWNDCNYPADVYLTEEAVAFGVGQRLNIKVECDNLPSNTDNVIIELKWKINEETRTETHQVNDAEGGSFTWESGFLSHWGVTRYKTRTNEATIKKYTTNLTTEIQLDIAVEKAVTWYGILEYNNYVQEDIYFSTKNSSGTVVKANGEIIEDEYGRRVGSTAEPIMVSTSGYKPTGKNNYTGEYKPTDSNGSIIFAEKSIGDYAWTELGSRVEKWYANLKADEIAFWLMPGGHLTHSIYTQLDTDKGYQLSNDNELLNIRFTYAMENGPEDWWIHRNYLPTKMTCEAIQVTDPEHPYYECLKDTGYAKGYLYETIDKYLVQGTAKVKENTDFFLSLLKNNTGEYSIDAEYNPNGKEVVYETVYGSEDRVGRFFETSAEMLFSLLNSSPYTDGLTSVMKYILYEYTTHNYGVTEFTYEIINREGFVYI